MSVEKILKLTIRIKLIENILGKLKNPSFFKFKNVDFLTPRINSSFDDEKFAEREPTTGKEVAIINASILGIK
ncbi:hypothetical protein [Mycoplasmopsis agassizii]|uniref:hypothetical protein n=1 Tax=Mycoplasmopsis agassizii TaxID=33922 RepID=UPI00117C512C|nr:hypothetical protein [Mycoplasmopsis agassizii]